MSNIVLQDNIRGKEVDQQNLKNEIENDNKNKIEENILSMDNDLEKEDTCQIKQQEINKDFNNLIQQFDQQEEQQQNSDKEYIKQETIQDDNQIIKKQKRKRKNKNSVFQIIQSNQQKSIDNIDKDQDQEQIQQQHIEQFKLQQTSQEQLSSQKQLNLFVKNETKEKQKNDDNDNNQVLEMVYINHHIEQYPQNKSNNSILEENTLLQKLECYKPGKLIQNFVRIADKTQYIKTSNMEIAMTFSLISTLITIIPQSLQTWLLNKQGRFFQITGFIFYSLTTLVAIYIILTYTVEMEEQQIMNWSVSLITTIIFDQTFIQQALDILYVNLFQYSINKKIQKLQNLLLIIKPELLYLFLPNILTIDLNKYLDQENLSTDEEKQEKNSNREFLKQKN